MQRLSILLNFRGLAGLALLLTMLWLAVDASPVSAQNCTPETTLDWGYAIGGAGNERSYNIAVDGSGNVYTTGFFQGTADFDPGAGSFNLTAAGGDDIFLQKLDSNGNFVWARGIGSTGSDTGFGIAIDTSGNVYTTGEFQGTVDFDPGAGIVNLTVVGGGTFMCKN
jgi:hypothetical protein